MEQILAPLLERAAGQLDDPSQLRRVLGGVLERAARRALGIDADVEVDPISGTISIVAFRRVVEGPAKPDEIELAQALSIDSGVEPGDELGCVVELDALAPYLRGALVVPAEQYPPLHALLSDLMWDREVLASVPRRAPEPEDSIVRLAERLRESRLVDWIRPGCDSVELEAHEMMLGCALPRGLRELLAELGGMRPAPGAPRLGLFEEGYRLLSPTEAQREHADRMRLREAGSDSAPEVRASAVPWEPDWLPLAEGSRGDEVTSLLVADAFGATAERPGHLLCISNEKPGWWRLGVDVAGLAHVWHMLALHGLLEFQALEAGDPIASAKAEAMAESLLPARRWVDGAPG